MAKTLALIKGKQIVYDACSKKRWFVYKRRVFKYVGKGTIYSVDGVVQNEGFGPFHFWVYRKGYEHIRHSFLTSRGA